LRRNALLSAEFDDGHLHFIDRVVALVAFDLSNAVCNFHPLEDTPENGVLPIEPRCISYADEKRGVCTVRIGTACCGDDPTPVRNLAKFGRYPLLGGIARSPLLAWLGFAVRIAALNHEPGSDAKEGCP